MTEGDVYIQLIPDYAEVIVRVARGLTDEEWEWQWVEYCPSARMVAEHTWMWLRCDRQQIELLDIADHQPMIPPEGRLAMAETLHQEAEAWRRLIKGLTPERLDETSLAFGQEPRTVRGFIAHMINQVVYKTGQISMIVFALGKDGKEPYTAPNPNEIYEFEEGRDWPKRAPRRAE